MNFPKLLFGAFLLFCCLAGKTQTTKPDEKRSVECCRQNKQVKNESSKVKPVVMIETAPKKKEIACKLTSPELQKRKTEVIALLKIKVLEKQELHDGYKYKFSGTDEVLDEVSAFIKSERACCDFFTFDLSISEDVLWLSITGPDGAKNFIKMEMDL